MGEMIGLVKYLAVALLFTSLPAELRGLWEFSSVSGFFLLPQNHSSLRRRSTDNLGLTGNPAEIQCGPW